MGQLSASILAFTLLTVSIQQSLGFKHSEDIKLSPTQLPGYTKFKVAATTKAILVPIMKEDDYLIKFYKSAKEAVKDPHTHFDTVLKWRATNKIEANEHADFGDIEKSCPHSIKTESKAGHPILAGDFTARCNFESLLKTHGSRKMSDFFYSDWEQAANAAMAKIPKNISRWIYLVNLDGFTSICGTCLTFYSEIISHFDSKWPKMVEKFIFYNTPAIFGIVLEIIKPIMSAETRGNLVTLGNDNAENKKYLLDLIDENQLPKGI